MSSYHCDDDDPEADVLRAEDRRIRAGRRPCPECSGCMASHVPGCPEETPQERDDAAHS